MYRSGSDGSHLYMRAISFLNLPFSFLSIFTSARIYSADYFFFRVKKKVLSNALVGYKEQI